MDGKAPNEARHEGRKRIMTLNRALASTSVALGALLAIQVAIVYYQNLQPPQRRFHASWIDKADTLAEGLDKSDHVILGEVIELKKGRDLVVSAPGEPGGEDRIETTIVKLKVHKTYKGAPGEFVELMQTGHSTDAVLLPGNPFSAAQDNGNVQIKGKRGVQGQSKSSPMGPTAGDSRATILEDDPPYLVGEKYVLFLKDMKQLGASAGASPKMKRVLAPEGRFQITKGDRLKPATTRRGFAPTLIGKPLAEFEARITP
jgi:hypothetical protein